MIFSFTGYLTPSQFIDNSFPQCNIYTGVQGGSLAFISLNGYLNLPEFLYCLRNVSST